MLKTYLADLSYDAVWSSPHHEVSEGKAGVDQRNSEMKNVDCNFLGHDFPDGTLRFRT